MVVILESKRLYGLLYLGAGVVEVFLERSVVLCERLSCCGEAGGKARSVVARVGFSTMGQVCF